MAQFALHGVIGLSVAMAAGRMGAAEASAPEGVHQASRQAPRQDERRAARRKAWAGAGFGLVLGSLLPDTDFLIMLPVYLFDSGVALGIHRTFTHSVITAAAVAALLWLWLGRRDGGAPLAAGVGAGMLLHSVTDVFTWFGGVSLLWPLGFLGVPDRVDLWSWLMPPRWASNLLGAADYPILAAYFLWLSALGRRLGTDGAFLARLRRLVAPLWGLTAVFTALSFALSENGVVFDVLHYGVFVIIFVPLTLYVTVKMRATLTAAAGGAYLTTTVNVNSCSCASSQGRR